MIRDTDVLIVGAGPTGLVLALWLTQLSVPVRIVDKTAEHDVELRLRRRPQVAEALVGELLQVVSRHLATPNVAEHREHGQLGDSPLRHMTERTITY